MFTQSAVSYSECIQGIYSRYFPVIWNINKPDKINFGNKVTMQLHVYTLSDFQTYPMICKYLISISNLVYLEWVSEIIWI